MDLGTIYSLIIKKSISIEYLTLEAITILHKLNTNNLAFHCWVVILQETNL
jgi:hypothetical protein